MTINAFHRSAKRVSALVLLKMRIVPLMKIAKLEAIVVLQSTGHTEVCALNRRGHMNSALQTLNVKTTCIAGLLHHLIVRATSQHVCLSIVNQMEQYLDGDK